MLKYFFVLLTVLLCSCSATTPPAQAQGQDLMQERSPTSSPDALADSPLAGTGIEPNVVAYPESQMEYADPLIGLNRAVFAFNDAAYRYVLIPAANFYQNSTPDPVKTGIGNFFDNILTPVSALNHLFQLEPEAAGREMMRFGINTTVGVLGILDPATTRFDMPQAETDFGRTLEEYGTGYGVYLVLPFIGPSNLRHGTGIIVDSFFNPLGYLLDNPEGTMVRIFDNFQEFSPMAQGYLTLSGESEDPYIFMRNLHLQGLLRDAQYKTVD